MNGFDAIGGRVYGWSDTASWAGRPEKTFERNGFLLDLRHVGVVALVDPPTCSAEQEATLLELGGPTHVLLTCEEHLREALVYRERFGCELWLSEVAEVEQVVDRRLADGERLWGCVDAHLLPDVYWPEETVFVVEGDERVTVVGDALCGGRDDIGVPDGAIGIFSTRYITDRVKARLSLERLAQIECTPPRDRRRSRARYGRARGRTSRRLACFRSRRCRGQRTSTRHPQSRRALPSRPPSARRHR